jgi:hypothetical protein
LFAAAGTGFKALHSLVEVEPPAMLVHNILAATIGQVQTAPVARPVDESFVQKLQRWMGGLAGPVLQPRFAMSFGMAFFSVSLMLHLSGVKAADFRHLDLRPSAIAKSFYETEGKLVRYYENLRVVYEIESRVQQLKRATGSDETPATPQPKEDQKQKNEPDPNQKQIRNHTPDNDGVVVAELSVRHGRVSGRTL